MIKFGEFKPLVISRRGPLILQRKTIANLHEVEESAIKHCNFYFKDIEEYLLYLSKMNRKRFLVYDHMPRGFHKEAISNNLKFGIISLPRRTRDGHQVLVTVFEGKQKDTQVHTIPYNKKEANKRKIFATW